MSLYLAALCYLVEPILAQARRDARLAGAAGAVGAVRVAARLALERLPVAVDRLRHDRLALGRLGTAAGRIWRDMGRGVDFRRGQCRCSCRPCRCSRRWPGAGRIAALLFAVPALLTQVRIGRTRPGRPSPIAAVQGAVPQDQKWQAKNRELTMQRYSAAHRRGVGRPPHRLAGSLAAGAVDRYPGLSAAACKEQGRAHDADFAIGLVDYRPATKQYFNGILVLSSAGDGWYYKRHLVPFGEYFPVPAFVRALVAADESCRMMTSRAGSVAPAHLKRRRTKARA